MFLTYFSKKLLCLFCLFLFSSPYVPCVLADEKADANIEGYGGGGLIFPEGELRIGSQTVWTLAELTSNIIVYKENPNAFNLRWSKIRLKNKDGSFETVSSIESFESRNFISVFSVPEQKIIWIPFEAIKTIRLSDAPSVPFTDVRKNEEVFKRFWFRLDKDPYPNAELSTKVDIDLIFSLPSGSHSVTGYLFDALANLSFFDGTKWKEIPWGSVKEMTLEYKSSQTRESLAEVSIPKFTYRWSHPKYLNTWNEYSLAVEK